MPLRFLLASCVCLLSFSGWIETTEGLVSEDTPTAKSQSLPPGVIARLGGRRFWHDGVIGAIAASSDGKLLATAEAHGRWVPQTGGSSHAAGPQALFRLWDARTGQQLAVVPGPGIPPQALAFSPDNRSLAVASMASIALYDVGENGELDRRWDARAMGSQSVSFAADGKSLFTDRMFHRELVQLDRLTGKTIRSWKSPEKNDPSGKFEQARIALLSSDGRRLVWLMQKYVPVGGNPGSVTMAGERLRLLDAATGKQLYSKWFPNYCPDVCFAPNSRLLAVSEESMIAILDSETGKRVSKIRRKQDFFGHLLFTPDSRILVAIDRGSGQVSCGSATTGEKIATFNIGKSTSRVGPFQGATWVGFSDSSTLWVGQDSRARRFDLVQGKETTEPSGHSRSVKYIGFSHDGKKLFSASEVESIHWDLGQQKEIRRSPDELLCVSAPLRRAIWQLKPPAPNSGPPRYELRDLDSGKLVKAITTAAGAPLKGGKRFEFAGKTLCCFSEDEVSLYDAVTGTYAGNATAHAASPDGKLLADCSSDGVITLNDLETGRLIRRFTDTLVLCKGGRTASLYRLLFSGDSKYLASVFLETSEQAHEVESDSNAIQVWEVAEGREVARITSQLEPGERFAVAGLALSPDHRFVAFGLCGHDGVQLWEVASQTERAEFEGQKGVVTSLGFSPTSTILASGAEDGTIWLRDVRSRAAATSATPLTRSDDELSAYWRNLTELDAKKAEQAMQVLIDGGPQSVAVIRRLCKPVSTPPEAEIDALVRKLDSDQFALRNQATIELGESGELARPAIEKALEGKTKLEARQRLQGLLRASRTLASSRRDLQSWRTIEILERIGSSEAKEVLRTLASGAAEARVTREAQSCLERMNRSGTQAGK
jgi:WD40 repeat protein